MFSLRLQFFGIIFYKLFFKPKKSPPDGRGRWGVPNFFLYHKSYLFCELKPCAKFQNPRTNPSGRKVCGGWVVVCKPIIVFSFDFGQVEKYKSNLRNVVIIIICLLYLPGIRRGLICKLLFLDSSSYCGIVTSK